MFKNLERPGDVFRDLGPNWFAAVMVPTLWLALGPLGQPDRAPGAALRADLVELHLPGR